MRLIDADELLKAIEEYKDECDAWGVECRAYDVEMFIYDAPTVDLWKYPAKGELPTEMDRYLCLIDENMPMVLEYTEEDDGTKVWFDELGGDVVDSVYAWQSIEPPKL